MKIKLAKFAFRISLVYAAAGCLWILFSGRVLSKLFLDSQILERLEIFKGLAFVIVTALLLYIVLHRQLGRWEREAAERKRAEEALQNNERFLRLVMDLVPHFIFVKDQKSRHLLVNRACAQAANRTPDQMVGFSDMDLSSNRTQAESFMKDDQEVVASGQRKFVEEKLTDANGQARILQTTKIPFPSSTISFRVAGNYEPAILGVAVDITERKKAEDALREKQVQLEAALQKAREFQSSMEQASDAVFWLTQDGGFSYVNEQACRSLGYTCEELMQLHLWDIDPAFPKERWSAQWERYQNKQESSTQRESFHYRKDGSSFPVSISSKHLWFGDQELHMAVVRDITERKQMEETLARERSLLRTLIDNLPDGVYAKDVSGRKILANTADVKTCHCQTEAELLGKTDFDLFPNDIATKFWADDQKVIQGQPIINREEYDVTKDNRKRWLLTSKLPLREPSGKVVGIVGIGRDITDRKMVEEELRHLNRSLETLSKCNEALVRATDENSLLSKICSIITEVGEYTMAWVGYAERDEAKSVRPVAKAGKESGYVDGLRVTWADAELGRGPVGTAIRTGQPAIFLNVANNPALTPWRDEALRRGFSSIAGLPLKAGEKTFGALCVYSSRPNAFNAAETALLVELAADLAFGISTLRNRNERNQLEEQLRHSQKMEAIGQLAGGVAHDFNNMLTVIQGNASLLSNPQLSDAERMESAQQVVGAAERAAGLTRQLLLFSRKQVMQAAPLNLNEIVGNMTKMLHRILGEDISLNATYASNLLVVEADPGMIEQVLLNLAVNSRDAMPQGGRLTIKTRMETLDKTEAEKRAGAVPGTYACLEVTDTGCGIASETLPHIFEPFFTTKAAGKGTGLGLATVYGIVQQHRGWISVNSQPGQGTSFNIYLPAAKGAVAKMPVASAVSKFPRGTETILLVEDEPPVRLLASNLLQRCGYKVLVAESGAAALPIWKENREKIDMLLTDIVMPEGISGRELAQRLKSDRPDLKVIYTSGYSAEFSGREPKLIEGKNFLQKPYHPYKLAETIRNCLNQKP